VRACTDAGLLADVAHASKKTFWDMLEVSSTPPFSSHSGADGVHPHPRNLDDDQIRALAARGGIVGVIFVAAYLGGAFCTLERVADHIEHVARVGGDDCVALGSDFDGFMPLPRGLRDAADLPRLTELLWRRDPPLPKPRAGTPLRHPAKGGVARRRGFDRGKNMLELAAIFLWPRARICSPRDPEFRFAARPTPPMLPLQAPAPHRMVGQVGV